MSHKCEHEGDFKEITVRLEMIPEIRNDVKALMVFKWQILGLVGTLSGIALIVNVVFTMKQVFK